MSALTSMAAAQYSIDVKVSDVSKIDASIVITPSDPDVKYYWMFDTKANFEANGGKEGIVDFHIEGWKRTASYYNDTTWQEMMSYFLYDGKKETYASDEDSAGLMWGTDYVVYAFGMDTNGNLTTDVTTAEFTTLPTVVSENTFKVKIVSMIIDSAEGASRQTVTTTVQITPSNDDPYVVSALEKRYVSGYDLTPGSDDETAFLRNQIMRYMKAPLTGPQTLTFTKQRVGTDFCIVTVGMDGAPTTAVNVLEYTAEEKAEDKPFILEVTNVSQTNAHIKIVPPTEDMKYYWYYTTPEVIAMHGGRDIVDEELDFGWYKYVADLYGNGTTWQELMLPQLTTGTLERDAVDTDGDALQLKWDTDYVMYAYGLNDQCERITDIYFTEFKTKERNVSDLSFTFEPVSVEDDPEHTYGTMIKHNVTVDIIPSNPTEQYAVNYSRTKYLDWYETEGKTWDDYIYEQFMKSSVKFTGDVRIVMQDISEKDEYYLVVMGWDEAPNTDIFKYKFTYYSMMELTAIDTPALDEVKVVATPGAIYIEGDYESAVVYNLGGAVVGVIRDSQSLSLSAGVYVVTYTVSGENRTAKVIVK